MQTFQVDFKRFWLGRLTPSSAAVALLAGSLIGLQAWASPLFVGLTAIETRATDNTNTAPVIEFKADLPFHYQMQILDKNRVVFRLYNVSLARNLLTPDGQLNLLLSDIVQSATLRPASKQALSKESYQEIVFQGPGLGDQKIQVIGATELPLPKLQAKSPATPVVQASPAKQTTVAKSKPAPVVQAKLTPATASKIAAFGKKAIPPLKPAKFSSRGASISLPNLSLLEQSASTSKLEASENQQASALMALSNDEPKPPSSISQAAELKLERPASQAPLPTEVELDLAPKLAKTASSTVAQPAQPRTRSTEKGPQIESQMRMPAHASSPIALPQATTQPAAPMAAVEQEFEAEQPLEEVPTQASEVSAPELLIPLPRYQGGAPPIQAATVDAKGNPVLLRPKNAPIQELQFGKANGGFNALFHAESPELEQPRTVDRLMTDSLSLFHEKQYGKSKQLIDEALSMEPANADLHAALAEVQLQLQQTDAALHAYQRASQLAPQQYGQSYAQVLIQLGKRQEALQVLIGLNQQQPKQAQTVYMLGTLYEELGQVNEALPYLQQAAQLHPASADIQYNLGLAYELAGDHEQAEKHYRHATELSPTATDAAKALERVRN